MGFAVIGGVARRRRRSSGRGVAAIYTRYSTRDQHSTDDQIRRCRELAEAKGFDVPDEFIFSDEGVTGRKSGRPAYQALLQTLAEGKVDAVIVMATSRLHRRQYKALQFANEEVVSQGVRFLTVARGIDSADQKNRWETLVQVFGIVDEMQTTMYREHIRAAHEGMLDKGHVFGTITFGYRGEEIPGESGRNEKPRRRYVIDEDQAKWVRRIFSWYVEDRLSRAEIVRRLNAAGAPLPPRVRNGRWTDLAVKTLLSNERYRGQWQYGATECVWLDKQDYLRQFKLDEPRKVVEREDLRIVDDVTWFKAQELRASNKHNAGRRAASRQGSKQPRLLNGILKCAYHKRPLVLGGGHGKKWLCPECQATDKKLFTHLSCDLARQKIVAVIAESSRNDAELVRQVINECRVASEKAGKPDDDHADELKRQLASVGKKIDAVQGYPVESEEDVRENQRLIGELRKQRASLKTELAEHEAMANRVVTVPSDAEVRKELEDLAEALDVSESSAAEDLGLARRIVESITGGEILVEQQGPRRPCHGWCRGTFKMRLVNYVAGKYGIQSDNAQCDGQDVVIDFKELPIHEQIADEAKRLWDEGLKYTEIAEKVGWNRNIVAEAIGFWHESRGLLAPDGRKHMSRLKKEPRLAERIADEVMSLVEQDIPLQDIAAKLGTNRSRITEAIKIWHEARDLPVPDGRALRKQRNERKRKVNR